MSWRVVPTFRPTRQLCRPDMYLYEPSAANLFFRDRYLDRVSRARPSATPSELQQTFDDIYMKHWEEFTKSMDDSFGVKIQLDQDANPETKADSHRSTSQATGFHDRAKTSSAVTDASVAQPAQGFEIGLDLSGYTPEEISVKIADNKLRVEARHEEKTDNGHVHRNYTREFVLPPHVDENALKSSLTAGGMLHLTAPVRGERAIPIDVAAERKPAVTVGATEKAEGSK